MSEKLLVLCAILAFLCSMLNLMVILYVMVSQGLLSTRVLDVERRLRHMLRGGGFTR